MTAPIDVKMFFGSSASPSLKVQRIDLESVLNQPFAARVRVILGGYVSPAGLIGAPAALRVIPFSGRSLVLSGAITEASVIGTPELGSKGGIAPTYEVLLESQLARLRGVVDYRIFQDKTTKDIIEIVLGKYDFGKMKFDFSSYGEATKRRFTVQYRESDLGFISRLLEEDGGYFFEAFDLEADSAGASTDLDAGTRASKVDIESFATVCYFSDKSTSALVRTEKALKRRVGSGAEAKEAAIYDVEESHRIVPGKVTLGSYSFKKAMRVRGSAAGAKFPELEYYENFEPFFDEGTGKRKAQNRLQELQWRQEVRTFVTDSVEPSPGFAFEFEDDGKKQKHFVTSQRFSFEEDSLNRGGGNEFSLALEAIPLTVPFRAPRVHEKPRIVGPQTATIVCEPGAPEEGVLTDEFGRARIKFHWDRYASLDDSASCDIRVTQLQTSGSMALPRKDWEVVVEFIDGDPDRPIVTGRLYNGLFMPPYALPAGKTRTSLQTASSPSGGGRNEIRFEDAAGSEEVMINSQYNTAIAVANNRKKNVTKNETIIVGNNAELSVGANQTIAVTKGAETNIDGDHSLSVSGNRNHEVNAVYGRTVKGSSSTTIGGNWMAMIGSPLDAIIALGTAKAAEIASKQADKAFAAVSGAMQGAVDQVMGPVNELAGKVESLEGGLGQLADGKMAASAGVLGGAVALPGASDVLRSMGQGPAVARAAEGTSTSSGQIAVASMVQGAVTGKLIQAQGAAKKAIQEAQGAAGAALGGQSEANAAGPAGELAGFTDEDTATGPGYTQYKVAGTHKENVGALRLQVAVQAVNLNVKSTMSESVGAAHVEVIKGSRAESVEGASSEVEPAFVLVAKGDDVETVHGARQLTVGGAIVETVDGDYSLDAGAAATIIGAMHEMKAKSKITIKCGASSVVIDGSGITIQSILVNVLGASVKATKDVADG